MSGICLVLDVLPSVPAGRALARDARVEARVMPHRFIAMGRTHPAGVAVTRHLRFVSRLTSGFRKMVLCGLTTYGHPRRCPRCTASGVPVCRRLHEIYAETSS
jgi:hypothetical protein